MTLQDSNRASDPTLPEPQISEPSGGEDLVIVPTEWPGWDQDAGLLANLWQYVVHIWDLKLFKIGQTEVFVNQLVIALAALLIGVVLSKLIARRVGNKVLPRMHVEPGPASAIQSILYYTLLIVTAMIALQIADVPLTVFTIFGGALALGIGFGSQNVMNNFISGLILLLERPIQVGDLVTVADDSGKVIKIGARATHIQSYNGVTTIVPNAHLLENAVANWDLPDRKVRAIIAVGVAYGSDTALVKQVLESLLDDHVRVLESTENRALFVGFGDSSLDFELHFWISPRTVLDRRQIESDLRYKIDQAFRDHNITIPFPQRDMHVITPGDEPTPLTAE
jgi:potassium efflux system protein